MTVDECDLLPVLTLTSFSIERKYYLLQSKLYSAVRTTKLS